MLHIELLPPIAKSGTAQAIVELIMRCHILKPDFNEVDLARMLEESMVFVTKEDPAKETLAAVGVLRVMQSFFGPTPYIVHFYADSKVATNDDVFAMLCHMIDEGARMARFSERRPEGSLCIHFQDVMLPGTVGLDLARKYRPTGITFVHSTMPLVKSRGCAA